MRCVFLKFLEALILIIVTVPSRYWLFSVPSILQNWRLCEKGGWVQSLDWTKEKLPGCPEWPGCP